IHTAAQRSGRADEGGGQTSQHFRAIKSECLGTEIRRPGGVEYVHAHIISVGPDAQLGIVKKVGAEMKAVAVVCAGSISGGGNGTLGVSLASCCGCQPAAAHGGTARIGGETSLRYEAATSMSLEA